MSGRWQDRVKNAVHALRGQPSLPPDNYFYTTPPSPPPSTYGSPRRRTLSATSSTSLPTHASPPLPSRPPPTPPALIRSIKLLSSNTLEVIVFSPAGQFLSFTQNLNDQVGNDDGNFSTKDRNFSHSARNVRLVDHSLWAELCARDGRWQHDRIGLDITLPTDESQTIQVKLVSYLASHSPSLPDAKSRLAENDREDFRNLRLISGFLLAAECLQLDGTYAISFLDLDGYIGNDNGTFSRGYNFSKTAKDVALSGTTLRARLARNGGTSWDSSTDLGRHVRCSGGRLLPHIKIRPEDDFPPVNLDHMTTTGTLQGCQRLRLVKGSILLAECWTRRGYVQEAAFKLNTIFGISEGRLRPFGHDFTKGSEPAKDLKLEGSMLSMEIPQPASRDEDKNKTFKTYVVNLQDYLANNDGKLILRVGGNDCIGCANTFRAGKLYSPWNQKQRERLFSQDSRVSPACALCQVVREVLLTNPHLLKPHEVFLETLTERFNGDFYIKKVELEIKVNTFSSRYRLYLDEDTPTKSSAFEMMPRRKMSEHWFHPEKRWSTVYSWIENCFHNHTDCARTGRPFLPTRCLDIGTQPGDKVQLITPSKVLGRYACLSHCWGSVRTITLTSKTYATYTKGIPAPSLPQTYRDAIGVCQYLRIRYLWIDSLCILQDSKEDWLRESAKMMEYYGHCYVCIAATSSAASNGGLQITLRPSVMSAQGSDKDESPYTLFAYPSKTLDNLPHFSRADVSTLEQHFPLMRRGWVLQERWLAPRTLHFCGSEALFECAAGLSCECGHAQDSYWVNIGDEGRKMGMENMDDGAVLRRRPTKDLRWTQLIVAYSALNLTFSTDRLPAVSGLARDFAGRRSPDAVGQYLAGLWRNTIHDELVWFVGAPLLRHRAKKDRTFTNEAEDTAKFWFAQTARVREYIAPTWSWASVFDAVNYRTPDRNHPLCEVLDANVELSGSDPFSSVCGGSLRVKGRLARTPWRFVNDGSRNVPYVLDAIIGTQRMDLDDAQGIGFLPDYTITAPDAHQVPPTDDLFVLPVLSQNVSLLAWVFNANPERKAETEREIKRVRRLRNTLCLVLRRRRSSGEDSLAVYERVGFTEFANAVGNMENVDPNKYEEDTFLLV